MREFIVKCPCCGEEIKVIIDSSDSNPITAFLIDDTNKMPISNAELSKEFDIELGVT